MDAEKDIFLYGNATTREDDEKLVVGCIANGIDEEAALTIWKKMADFALYAFNKSHSAGYAVVSVHTAFLKAYYVVEFMTATLNSVIKKADKVKFYLSEVHKLGIKVQGPSVNASEQYFAMEDSGIRVGLMGLRNLGKMALPIIEERKARGEFVCLESFLDRLVQSVDKKMLESLIYAGALDCFSGSRQGKIEAVGNIVKLASDMRKSTFEDMWFSLPEIDKAYADMKAVEIPDMDEFVKRFKLEKEFEFVGMYCSEHPLDEYQQALISLKSVEISDVHPEESEDEDVIEEDKKSAYEGKYIKIAGIIRELKLIYTKKGDKMYMFKIEDRTSDIKCVIFPKSVEGNESKLVEGNLVTVDGKVQTDSRGTQIITNSVEMLDKASTGAVTAILVEVGNEEELDTLKVMLECSSGKTDVYIDLNGKKFKYNNKVKLDLDLQSQIQERFLFKVKY